MWVTSPLRLNAVVFCFRVNGVHRTDGRTGATRKQRPRKGHITRCWTQHSQSTCEHVIYLHVKDQSPSVRHRRCRLAGKDCCVAPWWPHTTNGTCLELASGYWLHVLIDPSHATTARKTMVWWLAWPHKSILSSYMLACVDCTSAGSGQKITSCSVEWKCGPWLEN